jgi:hypothetical protein
MERQQAIAWSERMKPANQNQQQNATLYQVQLAQVTGLTTGIIEHMKNVPPDVFAAEHRALTADVECSPSNLAGHILLELYDFAKASRIA